MTQFWLGLLGGFSGAALGVFGVEIVKFLLDPGKRLEELRDSILADMLDEIGKVDKLASAYWNGEFESNSQEIWIVEQDITAGLHGLVKNAVDLFENDQSARATCEGGIRALRSVVTGGNFGDGQKIIDPQNSLEIKTKISDLKRELRNQRHSLKRRFL